MPKITPFPCCCTAFNISDLGGTSISAGYKPSYTEKELAAWMTKKVSNYRSYLLIAITNDQQEVAIKMLEKHGFVRGEWFKKHQHSETKIAVWTRKPDFMER